jgi:phage-related tail protein
VDGEAAEAAKSDLAMLDDVIAGLTGTQEEATDGTEGLTGALNNAESELSALADAYNEAYEAALESIQGQYDLWDQVAPAVATSAGEINAALESQISYWQSYNDNLQTLGDRAGDIEGLSEMIASFADGSTESVNAIAGMASASDEDLRAMVANWQALQQEQEDASGSLADLETDFSESMDQIQTDMEDAVTGMSLPDEATESARETIQAFIDKANGMLPQVQAAYRQLAGAASAALGLDGGSGTSMGSSQLRTPGMDGYASGTTNATPGYHLVGENGPELVNFRGGEQVITSAQTAAMLDRSARVVNLAVSPVYQISGTADPDSLRAVLDGNNDTLRDLILGVIQEAQEDSVRRAYT